MKKSDNWHGIRILAAVTSATLIICTLWQGGDITGTCTVVALACMIYADWRTRLAAAQEDWDAYMAEQRGARTAKHDVQDAREELFRRYAGGAM